MGKNLIQQRRGRGTSTFRANSFRGPGQAKIRTGMQQAVVQDIIASRMHSAPLFRVKYEDSQRGLIPAVEGIKVGDTLQIGSGDVVSGTVLELGKIPVGALVCNLEAAPGDGGKFVRGSGTYARVLGMQGDQVVVILPSKKRRTFNPMCRAMLGTIAGGGRLDKPLMKAGKKFHKMHAKNKYWPLVAGAAKNAVSHPFGGKRTSRKGRPTIAPKNAPPGRMVGMIRPRKTGRARGTRVRTS